MRKLFLPCIIACAALIASCSQNDEKDVATTIDGDKAEVNFVVESNSNIFASTRAITQDGFRLHAFRQAPGATDFVFYKEFDLTGMTYAGNQLSGRLSLDAGIYKFVPSYGLTGIYNNWLSVTDGAVLGNTATIAHTPTMEVPEIFLEVGDAESLTEWTVDLGVTGQTITADLNRAVGRVDLLFLGAQRDEQGNVTHDPAKNPLGGYATESLLLNFQGITPQMNYFGAVPAGLTNQAYAYTFASPNAATIFGTGVTTPDVLNGFNDFSNLSVDVVPTNGAYFVGPYLFPQFGTQESATASFTVSNPHTGSTRTVAIDGTIPVEQNKVSIVVVWVLSDNIYTKNLEFIVTVETEWAEPNVVDGTVVEEGA